MAEVRKAWVTEAKKNHPDAHATASEAKQQQAHRVTEQILAARDYLEANQKHPLPPPVAPPGPPVSQPAPAPRPAETTRPWKTETYAPAPEPRPYYAPAQPSQAQERTYPTRQEQTVNRPPPPMGKDGRPVVIPEAASPELRRKLERTIVKRRPQGAAVHRSPMQIFATIIAIAVCVSALILGIVNGISRFPAPAKIPAATVPATKQPPAKPVHKLNRKTHY